MPELNFVQQLAVWALPVLFAITVHEVAHGWVARRLGDPTAMILGRLTLNPLKHIDPMGTVIIPILLMLAGGVIFGWAKPVPITMENLKHPKRDMAIVAMAGPGSNLIMAVLWAIIMKIALLLPQAWTPFSLPLTYMSGAGVTVNTMLLILNLIPVPPLDGGRIVAGVLPDKIAWRYGRMESYGLIVLLVLMISGVLSRLVGPLMVALQTTLFHALGL